MTARFANHRLCMSIHDENKHCKPPPYLCRRMPGVSVRSSSQRASYQKDNNQRAGSAFVQACIIAPRVNITRKTTIIVPQGLEQREVNAPNNIDKPGEQQLEVMIVQESILVGASNCSILLYLIVEERVFLSLSIGNLLDGEEKRV